MTPTKLPRAKSSHSAHAHAPYPSPSGSSGKAPLSRRSKSDRTSVAASIHEEPRPIIDLTGEHVPLFNDWQATVVDTEDQYLYIFGGCVPAPKDEWPVPTSDLYRLDLRTMQWTNLTDLLKPLRNGHFALKQPFEPRCGSAIAVYRHDGRPFLIIFGGWGGGQLRSEFITIDLTTFTWALHSQVSDGMLRIEPAMEVVGNRVYIFGGRADAQLTPGPTECSFCVIELDTKTGQWAWMKKDEKIPESLGPLGSQLGTAKWELGFLIAKGRWAEGDIEFDETSSFVNYDFERDRWSPLTMHGCDDIPPADWFNLRSVGPLGKHVPYLCAWFLRNFEDTEDSSGFFTCDVWMIKKGTLHDTLQRLNVSQTVWEKKALVDLELFHATGDGRLLLLGQREGGPETLNAGLCVGSNSL